MRWLNGRGRRERGAVAVVVALCMVVLMGFAALAIDVGSIVSDQQQLQNGADAGALAIADSCLRSGDSCIASANQTAQKYAEANKLDGQATVRAEVTMPTESTTGSVTVEVGTPTPHQNWFAGVLGMPTTAISARASATWRFPSGGAVLPLTFSWCEFRWATGGWNAEDQPTWDIPVVATMTLTEKVCTPPAHDDVPGGFGWLSGVKCGVTVVAGVWVTSDPGNDGANSCTPSDYVKLQSEPVPIPIYDEYDKHSKRYKIKGVASFTTTAYCFGPNAKWPAAIGDCPNTKRIEGYFTNYVDGSRNLTFDSTATDFGVGVVKLSE